MLEINPGELDRIFFTSDTHFFHQNIIKYCNRPFNSLEEMHMFLISYWNKRISKKDRVYHLGDLSLASAESSREVIQKLNGKIYLCCGSHDRRMRYCRDLFEDLQESYLININAFPKIIKAGEGGYIKYTHKTYQKIFLSHYCHLVWPYSQHGSWHLFGHSHGTLNEYAEQESKRRNTLLLDVGVDSHDFKPWSLKEIVDRYYELNGQQSKELLGVSPL